MSLSVEGLQREASRTGFRPEMLEKVHRLLDVHVPRATVAHQSA